MSFTPFISFLKRELKLFVWSALVTLLVCLTAFGLGQLAPYLQVPNFVPPSIWETARLGMMTGVTILYAGTAVNLFSLARDLWRSMSPH